MHPPVDQDSPGASQWDVGGSSVLKVGLNDYKSADLGGSEVASHGWRFSPVGLCLHAIYQASRPCLYHAHAVKLSISSPSTYILTLVALAGTSQFGRARERTPGKRVAVLLFRVAESHRSRRHSNEHNQTLNMKVQH
jgi:hypothetical protein